MASKTAWTRQLRAGLAHIRSKRMLLLGVSLAGLGLSAVLEGMPADVAFIVSVTGVSTLLLIMSLRISRLSSSISHLEQIVTDKAPAPSANAAEPNKIRNVESQFLAAVSAVRSEGLDLFEGLGDSPLVTVVIPCYNESRFVAESIASVQRQSFENWECIVVDDASSDDSLNRVWEAIGQDDRFRVLRHKVNSGLAAARNTGLRAAEGRLITFLDADDLILSESILDRVVSLVDHLDDPHVIGSYCGVRVEAEEVSLASLPPRMKWGNQRTIDFVTADSECPFNAHAPLMLTERLRSLGGFDESLRHGAEDWDLWYKAMRNGYVFVPSQYRTAIYRQKRRSMVRTAPAAHTNEAVRLIDAAHRSEDSSILRAPSPTPLLKPLGYYQALLHKARRSIQFAAIALIGGDADMAKRTLESAGSLPKTLLERHLDLEDLVRRGVQRALAIEPVGLRHLERKVSAVANQVRDFVDLSSTSARSIDPTSTVRETRRAVLIPQFAGQADRLLAAARKDGHGQDSILFLTVERETGDQGARIEVPRGFRVLSVNEWILGEERAETLYVGPVRLGVVEILAKEVATAGGNIVEVDEALAQVMSIPDPYRGINYLGAPRVKLLGGQATEVPSRDDFEWIDPAAAWTIEEYPGTTADTQKLRELAGIHSGERTVIIGNGPSLNRLDLTLLKGEYTFAVNAIFHAADSMGFDPSYYVVEDTAVMRDNLEEIRAYAAGHKFFPSMYRGLIGDLDDVSYFMMNRGFYEPRSPDYCLPRFSVDVPQQVFSGQSVTIINLQLAYFLGFNEVVLIGMDFNYSIPEDAIVEGDLITSTGADPNHFHPDYFGSGKVWKAPKLDRVLANYALAKQVFEADGRRIVNATAGGKLELFDRVNYETYFA